MKVDNSIISSAIGKYGKQMQSIVCMEECAELIQAISKELRGKPDIENLAEEIADVYICLEMLMQMHNIPKELIQAWIDAKQSRMKGRIEADG